MIKSAKLYNKILYVCDSLAVFGFKKPFIKVFFIKSQENI